ncbi:hypothetical protein HZF05_13720 [Sphingomonas sp. CGMCC 1.13654]|uniref:Uncharacterized protein n=1 Tax=Sphingomonas chungangi TaxID=2683589 RepID=A0A838L6N2_9SPHN|nr:hypothetical protein [Sphingomonas chungangi]MBA2935143.1 hypothetical protein [Sphingomonas chungangi]MVW57707.1 hypothetical protein [Sphingomonas chungangi]
MAFLIACPLLALVPTFFEILQHIVEVHIGMYGGIAAARATEHDPLRMAFGFVKVIALMVPGYWITRFLVRHDAAFARRVDPRAIQLFAGWLFFSALLAGVQLFALPQGGAGQLVAILLGEIVTCLLLGWAVAAPLGSASIGPFRSIAIMGRRLPWTFFFMLAAILPLMVPHYIFAALAILGPKSLLWPIMLLDSLLVAWLTAVMIAAGYHAAIRATDLAGFSVILGAGTTNEIEMPAKISNQIS